jgi:hypothetical protein
MALVFSSSLTCCFKYVIEIVQWFVARVNAADYLLKFQKVSGAYETLFRVKVIEKCTQSFSHSMACQLDHGKTQ